MSKLSRAQAAALIADVRADNGGISREDREATPPAVLRALASVRRKLAGATKMYPDPSLLPPSVVTNSCQPRQQSLLQGHTLHL